MRLNGWQRIGMVASVIWAIGAPVYLDHAAQQDASEILNRVVQDCLDHTNNSFDRCLQRARGAYESVPRYPFLSANGAFVALAPLALGWILAYALVYLVRWIRAGFKP